MFLVEIPLVIRACAMGIGRRNSCHARLKPVEITAQVFASFDEADRADDAYYSSLSPPDRIEILLDLIDHYRRSLGEPAERLERVCHVAELAEG